MTGETVKRCSNCAEPARVPFPTKGLVFCSTSCLDAWQKTFWSPVKVEANGLHDSGSDCGGDSVGDSV